MPGTKSFPSGNISYLYLLYKLYVLIKISSIGADLQTNDYFKYKLCIDKI